MSGESNSATAMKGYIDRISRLEDERDGLREDVGSIYDEAATAGFSKAVMRRLVKLSRMDTGKRAALRAVEEEVDLAAAALNLLG